MIKLIGFNIQKYIQYKKTKITYQKQIIKTINYTIVFYL